MSAPSYTELSALNSRQIARSLLDGKDLTDASFYPEHFDWYWQAAYGLSTAFSPSEGENRLFTRAPLDCFDPSSAPIPPEAIFNIASISKPITAATILRMIEDKRYSAYFPAALETKLSHFYEMLESRYPESSYVRTRLRGENPEISLKDLILHASGIGDFDIAKYGQSFRFETPENLAKPGDGKHLEPERRDGKYGEYKYSDIGYELLGMVISAIATDLARKTSSGDVVTCGAVMRDLVVDRLELEHTFTPDEMGFDADGRVAVVGRPEQIIARGYDCQYTGNNLIESKVFRRCISASALYSNPSDICTFAKRTFSGKTYAEGGLFDRPETIEMQNKFTVVCSYEDVRDESREVVGRRPKVTPGLGNDKYTPITLKQPQLDSSKS
jgi:CubicO group peptidase (beta-lactamase class C family)